MGHGRGGAAVVAEGVVEEKGNRWTDSSRLADSTRLDLSPPQPPPEGKEGT